MVTVKNPSGTSKRRLSDVLVDGLYSGVGACLLLLLGAVRVPAGRNATTAVNGRKKSRNGGGASNFIVL